MYIMLDRQRMELQVVCGILENYAPGKEVQEINDEVKALREKMDKFMKSEIQPALQQIEEKIQAENDKFMPKQGE
jgi:hypothetical protein